MSINDSSVMMPMESEFETPRLTKSSLRVSRDDFILHSHMIALEETL